MINSGRPAQEGTSFAEETKAEPKTRNPNVQRTRSGGRPYSDRFKGVWIDFTLYRDQRFSAVQKLLLAEIYALEKNGGCWASNDHFVPLLGIGERMVRSHITKLEEAGHIRSENRTTKKRRLWIGDDLRKQIAGEASESPTTPSSSEARMGQLASASNEPQFSPTRNDRAAQPGNDNTIAEADFRVSRKQSSTENTLRKQEEMPKEKPKRVGDFSLPDWMPASLWEKWEGHCDVGGVRLTAERKKAFIAKLEELESHGFEFKEVMEEAMERGWKDFYPLPKEKRSPLMTNRFGVQFFGGRPLESRTRGASRPISI